LSIISFAIRGLNYGIDFKGGRTYVVRFDQPVKVAEVQKALTAVYGTAPEVKSFGESNQVRITTTYRIEDMSEDVDNEVEAKLYEGLKNAGFVGTMDMETFISQHRMSSQKVGPTISDDIKKDAAISITLALIAIFLYILLRFRNWQYGLGGVLSLAHDTTITLGIFSMFYGILPFSLEIDQAFIAAILTVIGYSINDTVIVYDRIREYLHLYPRRDIAENMNQAMNSTLRRTFNTSFSTLVVLVAIFLFGGTSIQGFTFALLVGILVGTYSSIFVATPIVYDTILKTNKANKEKKN
jgi:SecD/SecF fusion protein